MRLTTVTMAMWRVLAALAVSATWSPERVAAAPNADPTEAARIERVRDFDLGASTLPEGTTVVGPLMSAHGVLDRLTAGTVVAPWLLTLYRAGSVGANIYARLSLHDSEAFGAALELHPFYLRFEDLDRDGLKLRLWALPARIIGSVPLSERWHVAVELAGTYAEGGGSRLRTSDTRVFGVAAARTLHAGLMPQFRITKRLAFWLRGRALVGHTPLTAEARTQIRTRQDEPIDVHVVAEANGAQQSGGASAAVGVHWVLWRMTLGLGAGYGTWFIPWLHMPLGKPKLFAELNLHVRL